MFYAAPLGQWAFHYANSLACTIFVTTLIVHSMEVGVTDSLVNIFQCRVLRSHEGPERQPCFSSSARPDAMPWFRATYLALSSHCCFVVSAATTPRIKLHITHVSLIQISSPLLSSLETPTKHSGPNNSSVINT